jgi:tetratricopeptide (TPR) repeat protein
MKKPPSKYWVLARWAFLGFLCAVVYMQGKVIREAGDLARDLETEKVSDLSASWDRYHDIASRLYVPFGLGSAKKALTERLTASANRTITEYRDSDTTVYLKEWQAAQAALAKALQLDSSDKEIRGKMRLCEGHISRINAGSVQGKNWNDAKAKFDEAHDLLGKSPDPFLGLARLYTIARDLDKAEDMLHEAERRGYKIGKRDKAQLADSYRMRGELLYAQAPKMPGFNQQQDSLGRADNDLARAEDLYRDIVPYGNSVNMLQRVANDRSSVSQRKQTLKELDSGRHSQ